MALQLRVLGSTELRDADGRALDSLLAQPKRVALLAYLCVERPMRLHRRDSLLLLFWPDSDESRARGALSQSLSFLRRGLGDGVIATRGLEEVGVEPTRIETDVDRFERFADAQEHARALDAYTGDLLAGLHVSGCNEFDDWLSAERQRLRERAARSARAVAKTALEAGDGSTAVVAARHALVLSPLDESAARRVFAAYELAGRPALALAEYEAFRRRLRQELGVEPTADLQRLVERIRAGTPAQFQPRTE
jgi:DNA-binding SARP family transcriptional activator